jgi:hypothetical protein
MFNRGIKRISGLPFVFYLKGESIWHYAVGILFILLALWHIFKKERLK